PTSPVVCAPAKTRLSFRYPAASSGGLRPKAPRLPWRRAPSSPIAPALARRCKLCCVALRSVTARSTGLSSASASKCGQDQCAQEKACAPLGIRQVEPHLICACAVADGGRADLDRRHGRRLARRRTQGEGCCRADGLSRDARWAREDAAPEGARWTAVRAR